VSQSDEEQSRLEPDILRSDAEDWSLAFRSAAISMKRIADELAAMNDHLAASNAYLNSMDHQLGANREGLRSFGNDIENALLKIERQMGVRR